MKSRRVGTDLVPTIFILSLRALCRGRGNLIICPLHILLQQPTFSTHNRDCFVALFKCILAMTWVGFPSRSTLCLVIANKVTAKRTLRKQSHNLPIAYLAAAAHLPHPQPRLLRRLATRHEVQGMLRDDISLFLLSFSYFLFPNSCFLIPVSYFLFPVSYSLLPTAYFLLSFLQFLSFFLLTRIPSRVIIYINCGR